MKPDAQSVRLLGIARSKAKMYEYDVPISHHIAIPRDPAQLFPLAIGLLGDLAVHVNAADSDDVTRDNTQHAIFAAQFFDAYCQACMATTMDEYLLLLGSASYYLCGLPGSAQVLANRLTCDRLALEVSGLDRLLLWILKGSVVDSPERTSGPYADSAQLVARSATTYFSDGTEAEVLLKAAGELRQLAYRLGTSREVLFADTIAAVTRRRVYSSTWYRLPRFSNLPASTWLQTLNKAEFVKELWPAQLLLGEQQMFAGASGVVQMPTSAGKTRATEIVIRSALLSGRATLAVIVAPFRALCHEIRDRLLLSFRGENINIEELSDVLQNDCDVGSLATQPHVLVVTPEKLLYILRQTPELGSRIGLIIYDEGHQFDSGSRGITYELLLTSLSVLLPEGAQQVLFSAVITNAEAINQWINGDQGRVVSGNGLAPTARTVAFASWRETLGRLEFVRSDNIDEREFFVPRIIESLPLKRLPRERTDRVFPERGDGQSIALYLGLKLVKKGSVAVFCGMKQTAVNVCGALVEAYRRELTLRPPVECSDRNEVARLALLHELHMGDKASVTQSARLGVFAHHASTPQGIRLAVEHALKEGSIRFVVCTSTLAQGVNLPIRYLIFTNIYQAGEPLKTRDYYNLVGRAGRSGMHTEGSVLFAESDIYDTRESRIEGWRWRQIRNVLDPTNAEACTSSLLKLFEPLHSVDKKMQLVSKPLHFIRSYVENPDTWNNSAELAERFSGVGFTKASLEAQMRAKRDVIDAVENYLMAHWDDSEKVLSAEDIAELAQGTLAYHLADEVMRGNIVEMFKLLASGVGRRVPDRARRKAFGRTLFGISDVLEIEAWVTQHIEMLLGCSSQEVLFDTVWPMLERCISNERFVKCMPRSGVKDVACAWIQGESYEKLYARLLRVGARFGSGSRARHVQIEHVVDICENALAFEGMLVLGAIAEIVELLRPHEEAVCERLRALQKRIKYGLLSPSEIVLYELGFCDRIVAQDIASIPGVGSCTQKRRMADVLERRSDAVVEMLGKYPTYFATILNRITI